MLVALNPELQGLFYMHENYIVHGYVTCVSSCSGAYVLGLSDCKSDNIMADTACLFDSPPHPCKRYMKRNFSGRVSKLTSRTLKPVKYYLIDFGLSEIYRSEDAPFLKQPPWGGDRTVPEHLIPDSPLCDPFAVDVYCLGNYLRESFLDVRIRS